MSISRYKLHENSGASPLTLVIYTLEYIVKELSLNSEQGINNAKIALLDLYSCLDLSVSEPSQQLANVYMYIIKELTITKYSDINTHDYIELIEPILSAWKEIKENKEA